MPEQCHAADDGDDFDLKNARPCRGRQSELRDHPGSASRQRVGDRPRKLRLGQCRHRARKRKTERSFPGTAEQTFEGIAPERDPAVAVDDRHALIQRRHDLPAAVIFFELVHVRTVRAVGEVQRHDCHRQHLPVLVVDHLHERHGEAGPDAVARTASENTLRPRSIDRLFGEERHDDFRQPALDDAIREHGSRDWQALLRPDELAERATERQVCQARSLRRNHDGRRAQQNSA